MCDSHRPVLHAIASSQHTRDSLSTESLPGSRTVCSSSRLGIWKLLTADRVACRWRWACERWATQRRQKGHRRPHSQGWSASAPACSPGSRSTLHLRSERVPALRVRGRCVAGVGMGEAQPPGRLWPPRARSCRNHCILVQLHCRWIRQQRRVLIQGESKRGRVDRPVVAAGKSRKARRVQRLIQSSSPRHVRRQHGARRAQQQGREQVSEMRAAGRRCFGQ